MNGATRSVAIYGGLLFLSLGAAWVQWTADPVVELNGKVVLLDGDAQDIEKVVWKSEDDEAVIEQRSDARGAYLWVDYTKWKEVKKPLALPAEMPAAADAAAADAAAGDAAAGDAAAGDAAAGDAAAVPDAPEVPAERVAETQVFKSGQAGMDLLDALSPMLAIRKIDGVDDAKLAVIGLDAPTSSLTITRKGKTTVLQIGGESYGTRDRYLRNESTGDIYLVDDESLRPLKYARTRLPDRTLFGLKTEDIAGAVITAGGSSIEVEHKNAQDKAKALWARAGGEGAEDEEIQTWMNKAVRLKGSKYADAASLDGDLVPRFQLTLTAEDGAAETLEVSQVGDDGDWYGQSEHTRGLIKLLRGPSSDLYDDAVGFAGE